MSKVIEFGRSFMTRMGCRVLIRRYWIDGQVSEYITLWTEDEDE